MKVGGVHRCTAERHNKKGFTGTCEAFFVILLVPKEGVEPS